MATVEVSRELKSLSKKSYCHKCQVTKRVSELKLCSRCQSAKYCSQACQKAHWKIHKAYCKPLEEVKLETVDEAWKNVFKSHGHKRTNVLEPITETLEQQSDRLQAWTDKWKPTILNWAFWAMNIPSSSTPEDKLSKFTFMFELQRRANPPTSEHYFEMHGAEIMHASEVILLLDHMKRVDILEEWRKIPRRKDTIQIMIVWKGHIIYLERLVPNFKDLRKKARNDPVLLGYDALEKNWVEELRKAIDSTDPEYHQKFYTRTWGQAAAEASFMSGLIAMRSVMDEIRAREDQPSSEVD
ncbi:Plasmid Orf3 domain-containing protein [Mycena venus]|uniref:Plasmid Orf3 domain-containing protein n=1 Tax=Mycena venus TaxID=2733690 RepID=A0A8H6Z348_9AGAR|nr:Plasmid Orf3 domain-containing protein [Mycena venus]